MIASDTSKDLALLKVNDTSNLVAAPLGHSGDTAVGDQVVAIGNALALSGGPTVTEGIVSALNRTIETDTGTLSGLIQTDAAISSGNSGGPLANAAVTAPTLLVAAERDTIAPLRAQRGLRFPDARLVVVPTVGHLAHYEAPAAVAAAIAEFTCGS